ncbi:interferon-induced protein with tetratricopeptide repeats 1-like [Notolabrus celidotus]|uniref:interferon-induced protein with tetratricopeptide repeats 1-like n=1 Tax=Notolabrus celidotus TaxID=1203425 RepID=UPI0014902C01|nr:interferon-induced protein with tetratricopeptide repeats 1-like [Notolabrus celidotus]
MSASKKSQKKLQSKLKTLECHFTWDLDPGRPKFLSLKEKLEDIGTEEGNRWLGHIYNLQGFIQYKLGFNEDAKSLFSRAAEAFHELRHADEGPWLLVNYRNLAWLHHHLGDEAESQAYLSKIDALKKNHPSPSQGELHPEVYAEKAWTLMKFNARKKQQAADDFEKAIRMQPDMVEWNTSNIIGLVSAAKHSPTGVEDDLLEKMRAAKEHDPENLYLAAVYLLQLAKKGEKIENEARELGGQILRHPVSSYSGIKPLLRVYTNFMSVDEAIDLAEKALEKHPDERYLKRCVALCFKWKILFFRKSRPRSGMIERAISLHRDVISLYPNSSFVKKIDLANVYAQSSGSKAKAEQIYQKLLSSNLEPADKQVLYNQFARHLHFHKQDTNGSIQFHKRAAAIPQKSFFRNDSIKTLKKIKDTTTWNRRSKDIEEFLAKLPE